MGTPGDDLEFASPTWDTFNPAEIVGPSYVCADSGFPVWRNIRAGENGGTLIFRAGTPWKETIPGGSFVMGSEKLTKTFAAFEALEGTQIAEVFAESVGPFEVLP